MAIHYIEHYGFVDDGHSLAHYGVPGMRWRRHKYTGSSSKDYNYGNAGRDIRSAIDGRMASSIGASDRADYYRRVGRRRNANANSAYREWQLRNADSINSVNSRRSRAQRQVDLGRYQYATDQARRGREQYENNAQRVVNRARHESEAARREEMRRKREEDFVNSAIRERRRRRRNN